jgi:hypothetical protein
MRQRDATAMRDSRRDSDPVDGLLPWETDPEDVVPRPAPYELIQDD